MKNSANPFYQPAHLWVLTFATNKEAVPIMQDFFDDLALSVTSFEIDEAQNKWEISLVVEELPTPEELTARRALLAQVFGLHLPEPVITSLEDRDWVSQVQASFPPLEIGGFRILGSHHRGVVPVAAADNVLWLDAGAAFGTGEHATTSGCLLALEWAQKQKLARNALDMGCGTGILAMSLAKRWKTKVFAVDLDPVSVKVTRENVRRNQLTAWVDTQVSDGYQLPEITKRGQYDLIFANILARPLVKLAPDLGRHLASGGVAILSGLLAKQEKMVLNAHLQQGMYLRTRFSRDGWRILVLGKN